MESMGPRELGLLAALWMLRRNPLLPISMPKQSSIASTMAISTKHQSYGYASLTCHGPAEAPRLLARCKARYPTDKILQAFAARRDAAPIVRGGRTQPLRPRFTWEPVHS